MIKDAILNADDRTLEAVECPEWNCTVWVRVMSGTERDDLEFAISRRNGDTRGFRGELLVRTLADENGERIFRVSEADQLMAKSAAVLNRLTDVALRVNGFTDSDLKELEKNSVGGQSAASGSG